MKKDYSNSSMFRLLSERVDKGMQSIARRAIANQDITDGHTRSFVNNTGFQNRILLEDIKTILLYQTLHGSADASGRPSLYDIEYLDELLSGE